MIIVYYKLVKIIINALGLIKVIVNIMIRYHNFWNLIIINQKLFLNIKF